MKVPPKLLLPLVILFVGLLGVVTILALRPKVDAQPPAVTAPLVQVMRVAPEPVDFVVRAHGTVAPRTETDLVPEVSGPVVWVSPALASGGFFEADEPLIRIDPTDYEVALESARAAVARTQSEYERAGKELERQKSLASQSIASAARFDDAENAERIAAASLREARAARDRAESDLERTEIRAPYAGRVRDEKVDVGQFVSRGAAVGRIYAVDYAEVRLPVPDSELGFLDLPMLYRGETSDRAGPEVRLSARFAGGEHTWSGRIVRTEGEIDPRSRMVNVVARVDDPYGRVAAAAEAGTDGAGAVATGTDAAETPGAAADRPPLAVGLFVDAEIAGRRVEGAFVVPRAALRTGDQVLVVDDESRVRYREVEVLRRERDTAIIAGGLSAGDAVVVSPLAAPVEGMTVRVEGRLPETPAAGDDESEVAPAAAEGRS